MQEDTLQPIPQQMVLLDVPEGMWGEEAISRIASTIGNTKIRAYTGEEGEPSHTTVVRIMYGHKQ